MSAPFLQQTQEQPLYILQKHQWRAILPKTVTIVILGSIFYLLTLLNLSLLDLRAEEESVTKMTTLIIVLIIIIVGIFISIKQAHQPYYFFKEYLVLNKKKIMYQNINSTTPKKDLYDKIFHTSSITIQEKETLLFISDQLSINTYLDQMISYAKQKQPLLP